MTNSINWKKIRIKKLAEEVGSSLINIANSKQGYERNVTGVGLKNMMLSNYNYLTQELKMMEIIK